MVDLSIIIPMFNSELTIRNTIESILSQTISVKEIIVVNDGSTDDSEKIVSEISDQRVLLINQENSGTSTAKNNGIMRASGKFVMFIDSDDVIESDYIEQHFKYVQDCDLVCSGMKVVYPLRGTTQIVNTEDSDSDKVVDIKYLIYLLEKGELINVDVAKVYKREILISNHILFDEKLRAGEDLRFNCEYFKYIKNGILLNYNGYHYIRLEKGSLVSAYKPEIDMIVDEQVLTRKNLYDHFSLFDDEYFVKRFNYTTLNAYIAKIPNYYRKSCPLTFSDKTRKISIIKKEISELKDAENANKKDYIMFVVLKNCAPMIGNIIFSILFFLKNHFHFVYRKFF